MTIRPPLRERARLTLVPRARRRSSSTRSRSGSATPLRGRGCRRLRLAQPAHQFLGLADRELLLDDGPEDAGLGVGRQTTERASVAFRDLPARERGLDRRIEVEEPQGVGDGRASPADPGRDRLVAVAEHIDELPVGKGGLDRVEVLALEVLDERELQLLVVGELADDRGDPVQAGRDRGARRRRSPATSW